MRKENAIIIYGAGEYGKLAYLYYQSRNEIKCYIDGDSNKWGKDINGVLIYPPYILKQEKEKVIIAVKYGAADIVKQLKKDYNISDIIIFGISEEKNNETSNLSVLDKDTCVVAFRGGLGNQMFQYAFFKALERKQKVYGDISAYRAVLKERFELTKVFGNISLNILENDETEGLLEIIRNKDKIGCIKFLYYNEPMAIYETHEKCADMSLLEAHGGIFQGLFQSYKYAELVKKELLNDFSIVKKLEIKMQNLVTFFKENNILGIHIRRGDYLSEKYYIWYNGICTEEYYKKAIRYMREHLITDFIPCFFSDDIEWVKTHYKMDGALYIDEKMFDEYEDWYDMLLMSKCSHNIIANSTFSWWGAWLNRNEQKIVIAPEKWVNGCDYLDIYPKEWIKI